MLRWERRFPGGVVPFGYHPAPAPDGPGRVVVVDPEEAMVAREIATRLLDSSDSLVTIARDLTDRGIPTTRSAARAARQADRPDDELDRGTWRSSGVSDIRLGGALLGRTTHRGEVVRDEHGLPAQVWEPVLDGVTAQRLRPTVARPRLERAARLLSGLAFCAHCDGKLYVKHADGGDLYYGCSASGLGLACPTPRIKADHLDQHVAEYFLALDGSNPETRVIERASSPATASALGDVEVAISGTTAELARDDADLPTLVARLTALKARRAELRQLPVETVREVVRTGRTIREAWDAATDPAAKRTALLDAGLDHVTVSVRERRGKRFDPTRVRIFSHADVDDVAD